jgi:sulfoxide reductase heme-binding subunit YedZ
MVAKVRKSRIWPFIILGVILLVLVVILLLLQPTTPLYFFLDAAALLGYLMIFVSALSSAYLRELVRWLGRPFIQTHHILSVTGLAMIILHPILAAIAFASPSVFVPTFGSVALFFQNGGRLAWYLLAVAALAALFRKVIGRKWRFVHWLTYITFWLGTIHALLLGPSVQNWPMRTILVVLALILVYVFVHRRIAAKAPGKTRPGGRV